MFTSRTAVIMVQSIMLVPVFVIAAIVGAIYVFLNQKSQQIQTIKIGVCNDLGITGASATVVSLTGFFMN